MDINQLLQFAIEHKASDIHLSAGLPAMMRVDGDLRTINAKVVQDEALNPILYDLMNDRQRIEYQEFLECDFSVAIPGLGRFRVNAFKQSRGTAAVFRIIPSVLLSMDDLSLPPVLKDIANVPSGLVLVTGPTGSGKSTTLAALVDHINTSRSRHIVTIEDPIEFIHSSKKSLINQREVHRDTLSFKAALRSALREDPDVILLGELRDLETIRLAITAAETGHLVLATLHTSSATKSINRMIDVFPVEEKALIRSMLSESLQAVVAQRLVKKNEGGRIAAVEIMLCTPAMRNLIREDKIAQMYSFIQTGQAKGMQTLDQHIALLVSRGVISGRVEELEIK